MLVLTRRPEEGIVIDGNIKITILEIRGNQVRLGIEAPKEVAVLRSELVNDTDNGITLLDCPRRTNRLRWPTDRADEGREVDHRARFIPEDTAEAEANHVASVVHATSLNLVFAAPQTGHLSGASPTCVWPQTSQT